MVPIILIYLLLALLLALHLHPLSFLLLLKQQKLQQQTNIMQGRHEASAFNLKFASSHNFSLPGFPSHASAITPPSGTFTARWITSTEKTQKPFHSAFRPSEAFMGARFLNASRLVIVDQFGYGHFRTIQDAVDSVPVNNTFSYTILVAGGLFDPLARIWMKGPAEEALRSLCGTEVLYSTSKLPRSEHTMFNNTVKYWTREKVTVPHNKPFIKIQGLGRDNTFISWHDTAATYAVSNPDKLPGRLGTFHSATIAVNAPNFIARGMTFQNTAPAPANGVPGGQAVALQVSGDQVAFYDCSFRGRQDTLYDHKGRHYFRSCYIEGSIDFIFGDGLSLYKGCQINAVGSGFITAQKRQNASDNTGFSFVDCQITGSNASLELYLGRAWGPFSRVVFACCYMEAIVAPQGWHNWGDASRELTVSYSEFNCSGPGARASKRVIWSRQLDRSEVSPFINISFVQGDQWLPYE